MLRSIGHSLVRLRLRPEFSYISTGVALVIRRQCQFSMCRAKSRGFCPPTDAARRILLGYLVRGGRGSLLGRLGTQATVIRTI